MQILNEFFRDDAVDGQNGKGNEIYMDRERAIDVDIGSTGLE
jgi:hypothetical protein